MFGLENLDINKCIKGWGIPLFKFSLSLGHSMKFVLFTIFALLFVFQVTLSEQQPAQPLGQPLVQPQQSVPQSGASNNGQVRRKRNMVSGGIGVSSTPSTTTVGGR
ncbi:hypothetical protein Ddc_05461 [Ditylenchus destructor]|nr:hypothetical protein Ddc_05461 [Ditylenchus destructor]